MSFRTIWHACALLVAFGGGGDDGEEVADLRRRIHALESTVDLAAFTQRVNGWLADDAQPVLGEGRWIELAGAAVPRLTLERFAGIAAPDRKAAANGTPPQLHEPKAAILDFDRQLRARGIDLLFVVVPARVEVEPGLVAPEFVRPDGPPVNPATLHLLLELAEAGVPVLDLATTLAPDPKSDDARFLAFNQHWTPLGAARSARAVAAKLRAIHAAALRRDGAPAADLSFEAGRDYFVRRVEFDWFASIGPSPAEQAWTPVAFDQTAGLALGPADCMSKSSPLLLLGDSFLRFFEGVGGDFTVDLARELEMKLDVVAPPFGADRAGRDALRRRDAPLAATRTVVWVVPSTFLVAGPNWLPIDLGRPAAPAAATRLDTDPAGAGANFSCLARLAVDAAGRVHTVWQDDRDAAWTIRYRRAERLGAAWAAEDRLLSDPHDHSFEPRVAAVGENVYVAWRTVAADGASEGVRAAVSNDGGATFGAPIDLAAGLAKSDLVRGVELVARPDGGASVLWIATDGAVDRAYCAATEAGGSRFGGAPVAVSPPAANVSFGRIAVGGRDPASGRADLYVACAEQRGDVECDDVVVHVSRDGGATFPETLATCAASLPVRTLCDLLLGAAPNGALHVLWLATRPAERLLVLDSQSSFERGAPGSWRAQPLRVAGAPNAAVVSATLAVADDGAATAAFVAAVWVDRAPAGLFTRTLPPAAAAWSRAVEVGDARGATALLAPRLAALAAGDRPLALGWLERRDGSVNERPHFSARMRAEDPWRPCYADREPAPAKRRAAALSMALVEAEGGARLFALFDERCGVAADERCALRGAPEACCIGIDLR